MPKDSLTSNRIFYLDILRIIATFDIILLHLAAAFWYETDAKSFTWSIFNFYDACSRWGVPIFIMISGYLFLSKESSNNIAKIHKRNILRIITCFIFWSLLYAIYYYFLYRFDFETVFVSFIKGPSHMWFLLMIVGLYLITPFLKKITESEKLLIYFLALSFIFSVVLPQAIVVVGLFSKNYSDIFQHIYDNIHFHFAYDYVFYFVLGYYLGKKRFARKLKVIIYTLGICGFFSTVFISQYLTNKTEEANGIFYDNFSFGVLLESIFVFVTLKSIFENTTFSKKIQKLIITLSNCSFGIFLVHIMIISLLDQCFDLNVLCFNPIFSIPILGILVYTICFVISFTLNRIPKLSNYIV